MLEDGVEDLAVRVDAAEDLEDVPNSLADRLLAVADLVAAEISECRG